VSLGRLAVHLDRATQGLDVALDHVHAHAPAGNIRDRGGGGKTRAKMRFKEVLVGRFRLRREQAAFDCLSGG